LKLAAADIDVAGLPLASSDDARNRRDIVRAAIRQAEARSYARGATPLAISRMAGGAVAHGCTRGGDEAADAGNVSVAPGVFAEQSATTNGAFDAYFAVGDGVWDVETAAALGIPFIGVARGEQAARLRERGAEVVLDDLSDAAGFLRAIERAATRRVR
jgi:hypothetical protein